jgi:uncharacterized membrane protein YozB (DUF420 family)
MKKKHKIIITFLFTFIISLISSQPISNSFEAISAHIVGSLISVIIYLIIPFVIASVTFFNKPKWSNFWDVAMWVSIPLSCYLCFFE